MHTHIYIHACIYTYIYAYICIYIYNTVMINHTCPSISTHQDFKILRIESLMPIRKENRKKLCCIAGPGYCRDSWGMCPYARIIEAQPGVEIRSSQLDTNGN